MRILDRLSGGGELADTDLSFLAAIGVDYLAVDPPGTTSDGQAPTASQDDLFAFLSDPPPRDHRPWIRVQVLSL